ncbi:hypothetical protein [Craterilacuibacter sp.]|uniref:hypothetical protein n=1 Tax=Craterilacuibacter sp. TaxID=2870909 RepID=UPI003F39FE04
MSILLGLLIFLHISWPVLGQQLRGQACTRQNCNLALTAAAVELGFMFFKHNDYSADAVYLFAAVPALVYLLAVSMDVAAENRE